jgi:SH3-like domain-containing protein
MSDNSWYQVQSAQGNVGWVQQSLVSASGSCDSLPLIPAEMATDVDETPTETVLPFSTLEPTIESTTTSGNVPSGESGEVM